MTFSLQIAAVVAVLIVGGRTALEHEANSFERRHPRRETTPPGE